MLGSGDGSGYISLPRGGNGPIVLAEVAGGLFGFFSHLSLLFSFSRSL